MVKGLSWELKALWCVSCVTLSLKTKQTWSGCKCFWRRSGLNKVMHLVSEGNQKRKENKGVVRWVSVSCLYLCSSVIWLLTEPSQPAPTHYITHELQLGRRLIDVWLKKTVSSFKVSFLSSVLAHRKMLLWLVWHNDPTVFKKPLQPTKRSEQQAGLNLLSTASARRAWQGCLCSPRADKHWKSAFTEVNSK